MRAVAADNFNGDNGDASGETLRSVAALLLRLADSMDGLSYVHDVPLASAAATQDHLVLRIWAEAEYSGRRKRGDFLPERLFGEPAWDILLHLFVQESRQQSISITSACDASGASVSSALRWITLLEQDGLVERSSSMPDDLAAVLKLTPAGLLAISKWLRYRAALPS